MIFGHTLPSIKQPTLQLILNAPLPLSAPPEDLQAYTHATARLLENIAAASDLLEWADHLRVLLKLLSEISALLVLHGSVRDRVCTSGKVTDRSVGSSFNSVIQHAAGNVLYYTILF